MKKKFVPYLIAKDLKKIGYDVPCFARYTKHQDVLQLSISECCYDMVSGKMLYGNIKNFNDDFYKKEGTISAPSWDDVIDWLRKKYYFNLLLNGVDVEDKTWTARIVDVRFSTNISIVDDYKNYDEARENTIIKSIELIKKLIKNK